MLAVCLALAGLSTANADVLATIEGALPRTPPPRPAFAWARPARMTVVDAGSLDLDRKITLMALQGLANRKAPRLFVIGANAFNRDADLFWVERLKRLYGIQPEMTDLAGALRQYAGELQGAVVYRPEEPQTENVACMVGALLDLLPIAPGLADEAGQIGLPVRFDLGGCFPDRVAASQWAFDHLFAALAPQDVASLSGRTWLLVRDYAVMRGAFMCDLSVVPEVSAESVLKGRILDRLPPNSIQWGWLCRDDEGEYVEHASRHGVRTLCSTNSPNLSFLSQIKPLRDHLPARKPSHAPKPEPKAYLAFVLSDGDSIPILLTREWYLWDAKARGQVPFGWEMQPLLCRIAPVVPEYYYETATGNDEFTLGPSGAGYVHPEALPDPAPFFADTRRGLSDLSATVVGVMGSRLDHDTATAVSRGAPQAAGFFHGWGGTLTGQPFLANGKPHLPYRLCPPDPNGKRDDQYYARIAEDIRAIVKQDGLPCCIPIHLSCYWSGPDDVPNIMAALHGDPPAEVLLPGALAELAGRVYRDRLFLTAPSEANALVGLTVSVPVSVRSTRAQATQAELSVQPRIVQADAGIKLDLGPESDATCRVRLAAPARVEDGVRTLRLTAPGVAPVERAVTVRTVPPPEKLPEGYGEVQSVWEAEKLQHSHGHEVDDATAHNGKAWAAVEGTDRPGDGATVWGPYEPLPAGSYAVAFRCRSTPGGAGALATLDCFDFQRMRATGDGYLARRALDRADLPADGSYTDLWLFFKLDEPAKVEYRVWWSGKHDLVTDRVVVLRQGP